MVFPPIIEEDSAEIDCHCHIRSEAHAVMHRILGERMAERMTFRERLEKAAKSVESELA